MSSRKNTTNPHSRGKRPPKKRPIPSERRAQQITSKKPQQSKQLPPQRKIAQLPAQTKRNNNTQLARTNTALAPRKKAVSKQNSPQRPPIKNKRSNKIKQKKKERKKDAKKTRLDSTHLLPVLDYVDNGKEGFLLKNNIYMNIFRINNKDYSNMSENETQLDIAYWERLYRTIQPANLKILITNMPNNVIDCKDYLKRECKKAVDPVYEQMLKQEIAELEELEKEEFKQGYLFVYLRKYEHLINYNNKVVRYLCDTGLAQEIKVSEKLYVLNKLNCPHTFDTPRQIERYM